VGHCVQRHETEQWVFGQLTLRCCGRGLIVGGSVLTVRCRSNRGVAAEFEQCSGAGAWAAALWEYATVRRWKGMAVGNEAGRD